MYPRKPKPYIISEAAAAEKQSHEPTAQFALLGMSPAEARGMLLSAGDTKRAFPERYRDEWPESELISTAAREAEALGVPVEVAA